MLARQHLDAGRHQAGGEVLRESGFAALEEPAPRDVARGHLQRARAVLESDLRILRGRPLDLHLVARRIVGLLQDHLLLVALGDAGAQRLQPRPVLHVDDQGPIPADQVERRAERDLRPWREQDPEADEDRPRRGEREDDHDGGGDQAEPGGHPGPGAVLHWAMLPERPRNLSGGGPTLTVT